MDAENEISTETFFTVGLAAEYLKTYRQRIMYGLGKRWIKPVQEEPILLISKTELDSYKAERMKSE